LWWQQFPLPGSLDPTLSRRIIDSTALDTKNIEQNVFFNASLIGCLLLLALISLRISPDPRWFPTASSKCTFQLRLSAFSGCGFPPKFGVIVGFSGLLSLMRKLGFSDVGSPASSAKCTFQLRLSAFSGCGCVCIAPPRTLYSHSVCALLFWVSLQREMHLPASAFSIFCLVSLFFGHVPRWVLSSSLLLPFLCDAHPLWLSHWLEMHLLASAFSIFWLGSLVFGSAPCWDTLPALFLPSPCDLLWSGPPLQLEMHLSAFGSSIFCQDIPVLWCAPCWEAMESFGEVFVVIGTCAEFGNGLFSPAL